MLDGGAGDDLLIAGRTAFDNDHAALDAVVAEWTSERSYSERVRNLSGQGSGPRANGNVFLQQGVTVFDDDDFDIVVGGDDRDWFFYDLQKDIAPGRLLDEIFANELDDLELVC